MNHPPIELTLDLRRYTGSVASPDELLGLWARIEDALVQMLGVLSPAKPIEFSTNKGTIVVRILRMAPFDLASPRTTRFAVHGIARAPALVHRCKDCAAQKEASYGPFRCAAERCPARLCERHAVFIEGFTRPFCGEHAPLCACGCGARADFYCDGDPRRRARICDFFAKHARHPHPTDPLRAYCDACHQRYFSPCSGAGCANIGYLRCQHHDPSTLVPCEARLCPTHAQSWRIWGTGLPGPALCDRHAAWLAGSTAEEALLQALVAPSPRQRAKPSLPPLRSLRDALGRASRLGWLPHEVVNQALERIGSRMSARPRTGVVALALTRLEETKRARDKEVIDAIGDHQRGEQIFEGVKARYAAEPHASVQEVARRLVYLSYAPPKAASQNRPAQPARLFVSLPDALKGHAFGAQRARLRGIEEALGVQINLKPETPRGG